MELELAMAYDFAVKKHGKQMYGTYPYRYHLLEVLDKVLEMDLPLEYQIVALLHDTIEDTNTTWVEIEEGFGDDVALAVYEMSNITEGESYEDYLEKVKKNKISRKVKVCDILCNLKESYIMKDGNRKYNLIKKYERALFILGSGE